MQVYQCDINICLTHVVNRYFVTQYEATSLSRDTLNFAKCSLIAIYIACSLLCVHATMYM